MNESDPRRDALPAKMKQQLHDCVAAFEALLWQTLKGHLAEAAVESPVAPPLPPPQEGDARGRDTFRFKDRTPTESHPG